MWRVKSAEFGVPSVECGVYSVKNIEFALDTPRSAEQHSSKGVCFYPFKEWYNTLVQNMLDLDRAQVASNPFNSGII